MILLYLMLAVGAVGAVASSKDRVTTAGTLALILIMFALVKVSLDRTGGLAEKVGYEWSVEFQDWQPKAPPALPVPR